jgi:uncharacterized protein YxjI
MKLLIKQRIFSWTDTYDIYDESGNSKYFVKADFLTLGHVIHIHNRNHQEAGCVRQKIVTFLPKFDLMIGGNTVGTLKKEFTFFSPRYYLDCNGWVVQGDVFRWNYDVVSNGETIMHITKEFLHFGDTYVLDIPDEKNEIICLLIAIAIDAANCER